MLALRTLRNLQKYTVTLINNSGQGHLYSAIGLLKFISGNSPCSQYILNLPQTFSNNTPQSPPQTLASQPDNETSITWETQLIFTQPLTATIWHGSPKYTNLNVYIHPNPPYANL